MSADQFDDLARALARAGSRRATLKLAIRAATAAFGALALVSPSPATAAKKCTSQADCPKNDFCDTTGVCVHCPHDAVPCRPSSGLGGTCCPTFGNQCVGSVCCGIRQVCGTAPNQTCCS